MSVGNVSGQGRPATQEKLEGKELEDADVDAFLSVFEESLVLPEMPSTFCVLAPTGLIASGKSTVMNALAERFALVVVRTDSIRMHLGRCGYNNRRTSELAARLIATYVHRGYGVAVDADVVASEKREVLVKIAKEAGAPLISIHINTPEEIILERLRPENPDRAYKGPEAVERYYIRKTLHEDLSIDFDCVFDGSGEFREELGRVIDIVERKLSSA